MVGRRTAGRAFVGVLSVILTVGPTTAAASSPRPPETRAAPDLTAVGDRPTGAADNPQASHVLAGHETFQDGDLVVSTGNLQWYLPDGTLNLEMPTLYDGGVGFGMDGSLYVTEHQYFNHVQKFDNRGQPLVTYQLGGSCQDPASIVSDSRGNLYIGSGANMNCSNAFITQWDPADNLVANYLPAHDTGWEHGPGWIAIESDDCTFRYATGLTTIRRYNVCTETQLPNFSNSLTGAHHLAILPDGGMLVANWGNVVRLNASGQIVRTYDAPGEESWWALTLTLDKTEFYAASVTDNPSGIVYRFNVDTGAVVDSFDTGSGGVYGMAVYDGSRWLPPALSDDRTFGGPSAGTHGARPFNFVAEPVNTATGAYVSEVTDLSYPGRGLGLAFTRTYNSADPSAGVLGPGWTHSYAVHLEVNPDESVIFVDEGGARLTFASDGSGGFTAPVGSGDALTADGSGRYELRRRDQVVYAFDVGGRLTSLEDRNGNALSFTHTGSLLTSITDTVGRQIDLTYTDGLLTGLSGPQSLSAGYGYDPNGRLASVTDVRGKTSSYTYDGGGRLATIVDPNNHTVVTNTYGPDGRVSEQVDARELHSTYAWDAATETSTFTDARGGEWVDVYHDNVLVSQTDPLGNQTRYVYDAQLNTILVTNPRGSASAMTYDANRNLLTRSAGGLGYPAEEWTYNARNDVETYLDGRGNTTTYAYDSAGNLISIMAPLSAATEFGRDPAGTGLLVSLTDPRDKTTTFGYDADANQDRTTTPLGNVTTMTYDDAGRMLTLVEPRGNVVGADPLQYTTTFTYDEAGNLLTTTDPLSNLTTRTYDNVGNPLTITDANQHTTTYAYDEANHLAAVTDAKNGVTAYTYDNVGNLLTRTDAKLHVTSYGYDLANRLTSTTAPLNRTWTIGYDAAGNATSRIDANQNTVTYAYDALNRLTAVQYGDPLTPDASFGYDANSNRTSVVDAFGTETYVYDALNRLTSVTRGSDVFGYGYDLAGNITSRTYPGQPAQTLGYDNDGRLTGAGTTTYTYDPAANVLTAATADSLTARFAYDRAGRLLETAHTRSSGTLSRFTYGLDPVGNRIAITTRQGTVTYRYDELDRLTEACWSPTSCPGGPPAAPLACLNCIGGLLSRPAPSVNPPPGETYRTYSYDAVGNRQTETSDAGTTIYAYDDADRLTTVDPPGAGSTTYTFDANGNQTAAGATTFTYDRADRLRTAVVGSTTETYTYWGDGARRSASTGSQANKTTRFLWDRNQVLPQLALERNGSDSLLRAYGYGLDLVSQKAGSKTYYYHHDGLGSVTDVTGSTGTSLIWSEFYPYGLVRQSGTGQGAPTNPFGFTGEQRDPTTGLYHLRARQYDPAIGQFLSPDPAQASTADPYLATYGYADLNPVLYIDPSGRDVGGMCVTGEGALALLFGEFSLCAVVSETGQAGVLLTGGAGGGVGLGATAGVSFIYSNADEIYDLEGPFVVGGGSGALVVGVQGEGFAGAGHCGQIVSGAMGGVVVGATGSVQFGATAGLVLFGLGPPKSSCGGPPAVASLTPAPARDRSAK
jgi:RHS repeat-associated protein